jgi:hypothetical protein
MELDDHFDRAGFGHPDVDADSQRWVQWPVCPDCGRRRQTRCPTCDLGGDDFSLAELFFAPRRRAARDCSACSSLETHGSRQREEDNATVWLMCPVCEEAFAPEFYRLCQHCGHDFGDGLLVETPEADQITDRALLVMTGLIALVAALLVYFWLIVRVAASAS